MPGRQALVVGAGHNGLVAAIHLAAGGLDVTVLEHAPRPGGATSTTETIPGFRFDHCAGFNPMTMVSPVFRELRLEDDGLQWIVPEVCMAHPFEDGAAIALHRDVAATAASIDTVDPGRGPSWAELVQRTLPHADRLAQTILAPLPPVRLPLRMALAWRRFGLELVRLGIGSIEALGLDVFAGATRPTAWLASTAQHSGLPPDAAGSGLFGFLLQLLGHAHGWPLPRGGMGRLTELLVARLERAGGRVRCDAHVDEIIVRGGRVCGARLASGEELRGDAVISTVTAGVLAAMVPEGALPERVFTRLRRWRYGTGAFRIDFALDGPVPWPSAAARRAGVVQVGGELAELAKAAQDGHRGEVPERPALIVGQQSLHDPTRAPAGKQGLWVYAHVPSTYDLPSEEVAGRIEAQLERFAPGFSRLVAGRHIRPPRQTQRENPSLVGGDLAGGVYELDQLLVFRPMPEMARYRTPLRGLYVAGASVHPGGAVHGMSGRSAARALLADRAPLRLGALARYAGKGSAARSSV